MGSVVTQTRDSQDGSAYQWFCNQSGYGVTIPYWDPRGKSFTTKPQQVTTSYRSGRTASRERDDAASENIPRTFTEGFQQWKREYRAQQRPYDTGHEFDSTTQELLLSHPYVTASDPLYGTVYRGPLIPDYTRFGLGFPSWAPVPSVNASYYGPQAIQATVPTKSVATLAVDLAELKREGIPHLIGHEKLKGDISDARKYGSEYLGLEFGWKPIANSLASALHAVRDAGKLLEQYQRDSGKWVRRRHTFAPVTSVKTETSFTSSVAPHNTPNINDVLWDRLFGSSATQVSVTAITRQKVWFSGAYSYHLPQDNDFLNAIRHKAQEANYLLGFKMTPEVAWNLTPWSWFGDWNVNLGTNIANLSALGSDGLVIRYGYLMSTTVTERTFTYHNYKNYGAVSAILRSTRKQRVRANPFGFGSNPASYTNRQWSILAALGMANSPKSLF